MPRSVLLLVNRDKPEVSSALPEVRALIARSGRIAHELAADNSPLPTDATAGVDLIVVLGGDGTLISQTRRCVALGLPMLGVNFGKLGFLSEFDLPSLRLQAGLLFDSGSLVVHDRPLLAVAVLDASGHAHTPPTASLSPGRGEPGALTSTLALNEAVITAGPPYRMISLSVKIDGQIGPRVAGDGLIVATPVGSTAYNASAGGPIIAPDVSAMVITPIAAHSLSFRPVVVPGASTIELALDRVNDRAGLEGPLGGTSLVLDGQLAVRLHAGQRVLIKQHTRFARFVRNQHGSYWSTLIDKMRWAAPLTPSV